MMATIRTSLGWFVLGLCSSLTACGPADTDPGRDDGGEQIARREEAFSSENKARILYVGDSLAGETTNTVAWWTQLTGKAELRSIAEGGTAICHFLEGRGSKLGDHMLLKPQVRDFKPDLVILQFWGNVWDLWGPCMKEANDQKKPYLSGEDYYEQYFWDALRAVNEIEAGAQEAGILRPKILWVLQGPDKTDRNRTQRLNDIYELVAGHYNDRVSDAGWTVSMAAYPYDDQPKDRYQWTQYLPCTDFERHTGNCTHAEAYGGVTKLHKDDDPIHFCLGSAGQNGGCTEVSPAIGRYGMRIAHDANAWLALYGGAGEGEAAEKRGLDANTNLYPGQDLRSANGKALLAHQADGNVVLYRLPDYAVLWTTNTNGQSTTTFAMQADGNLVLYGPEYSVLWASNTSGNAGAWLAVQDDCNIVLYTPAWDVLWTSNTKC